MSILNVPHELLQAIFALDLSSRDLTSLCRTNKKINTIATHVLYSKIEWEWLGPSCIPPMFLFLRTLLQRKDLATHVKSLNLRGGTFSHSPFSGKKPPVVQDLPGLEYNEIDTAIRSATLDPVLTTSWISATRTGRMDALVALLLSQLPHLTRLTLETNFAKEMSWIGYVVLYKTTGENPPALQRLRAVKISITIDWDTSPARMDNTDAVLAMFYLPNIQHIEADIGNPSSTLAWPAHTPDPSSLTSLKLYTIREPHLVGILKVTRNLKSLSWLWDYCPDMLYTSPVVDLDAISAALKHVQKTLTDLTIDATTDEGTGVEFSRLGYRGTMGDALRNMQCLERLQAPFTFLLGPPVPGSASQVDHEECPPLPPGATRSQVEQRLEDVLPPTLRHLTITQELGMWGCVVNCDLAWDDEAQFAQIASWLRSASATTPHLRSMCLEFGTWSPLEFGLWGVEMQDRLRSVGAEVGVDIEII